MKVDYGFCESGGGRWFTYLRVGAHFIKYAATLFEKGEMIAV